MQAQEELRAAEAALRAAEARLGAAGERARAARAELAVARATAVAQREEYSAVCGQVGIHCGKREALGDDTCLVRMRHMNARVRYCMCGSMMADPSPSYSRWEGRSAQSYI